MPPGALSSSIRTKFVEAGIVQTPRRRKTRDTATHDHDRNIGPRIRGNFNAQTIAQAMTEDIGRADNLARRQRRRLLALACRERDRHTEKSGKNFATVHQDYFSPQKAQKAQNRN